MPPTIAAMITRSQGTLTELLAQRADITNRLTALRALLPESGPTSAELSTQIERELAARSTLDPQIDAARSQVESLEAELARDNALDELSQRTTPTGVPTPRGPAAGDGIQGEPRTYNRGNAMQGISFIKDVTSAFLDGGMAERSGMERIQRHMAEARVEHADYLKRDIGTSAFGGLTVPQYLTGMVSEAVAAGRPFLDNVTQMDLPPDGMSVVISRITTATSADAQSAELATVSETDIDDTTLTVPVRTISGQQDLSRQVIDRSVGAEAIVVRDLVKRYRTNLDNQAINADGTSGKHTGLLSTSGLIAVTYTDATPTPSEAWGPLWDMQQQIESGVYECIDYFLMHPRRWAFFCSAIGTNQTMVQNFGIPSQLMGQEQLKSYGSQIRGLLAGVPVVVDANVPTTNSTNQDVIFGINRGEVFLWEQPGAPLFIRAEQPGAGNLSVKLVVYGYSAFTAGRLPGAHGKITGTGLTTPTFGIAAS